VVGRGVGNEERFEVDENQHLMCGAGGGVAAVLGYDTDLIEDSEYSKTKETSQSRSESQTPTAPVAVYTAGSTKEQEAPQGYF
jgi:hypothetical protein